MPAKIPRVNLYSNAILARPVKNKSVCLMRANEDSYILRFRRMIKPDESVKDINPGQVHHRGILETEIILSNDAIEALVEIMAQHNTKQIQP